MFDRYNLWIEISLIRRRKRTIFEFKIKQNPQYLNTICKTTKVMDEKRNN